MGSITYLAEALRDHEAGDVATAIELYGCYRYDRFGRFLPVDGGEKENVLAALSEFYRQYQEWLDVPPGFEGQAGFGNPPNPELTRCKFPNWSDPVWCYGWPEGKLPNFSKVSGLSQGMDTHPQLGTTERSTLLIIIAALCKKSGIEYQERGAASQIAKLTDAIGATVSDDTIRRLLKAIPDALETRMK